MNEIDNLEKEIKVIKKNDSIQPFDKEKLIKSISRAGVPFMVANDMSGKIIKRINDDSVNNKINSSDIRNFVTDELKSRNQNSIAESYSGYKKNKITSIREEQFLDSKDDSKVSISTNTQAKQFAKNKDNTGGRGTKSSSPQSHQR